MRKFLAECNKKHIGLQWLTIPLTSCSVALSFTNLHSLLTCGINQVTWRRSPCHVSWSERRVFCAVSSLTKLYRWGFLGIIHMFCTAMWRFITTSLFVPFNSHPKMCLFYCRRQLWLSHGSSNEDGSAAGGGAALCCYPGRLRPKLHVKDRFTKLLDKYSH